MSVARRPGEPLLGNPDADGKVLSSTTAGVRSWETPSTVDTDHRNATTSVHGLLDAAGFIDKTGTAATDMPPMSAEFLPSTDWTLGAGWSGDFASGFTHASGGGTATLTQSKAAVNATPYQITYTVTGRTAGSFTLAFGGYVSGAITASGNVGPTSSSTASLVITPTTDFNGTIALSIKSITGASTPHIALRDSAGTVRTEVRVSSGFGNTFTGRDAGRSNTTGANNTFTGLSAGFSNTTGANNTFTGLSAGFSNTTGASNTFTGLYAGFSNTTGGSNTFTGLYAGYSNTTGADNTFTGIYAGRSNTTGANNTFTGLYAGFSNTTGASNTFTGLSAGFSNTTGANNTFTGRDAGYANTTGASNTFTGFSAGRYLANGSTANETSSNSVYMGFDTRASVAGAVNEAAIGYQAIGGGSNTVRLGNTSVTHWLPGATDTCYLGNTTHGFKALYLHDGTDEWAVTINTSGELITTKV